jgi:hypothetical protein
LVFSLIVVLLSGHRGDGGLGDGQGQTLDQRFALSGVELIPQRLSTRHKTMTLNVDEFMRRFLLHVLPSGFHRIRHYGLLSNGSRKASLARSRELLDALREASDIAIPSPGTEHTHVEHEGIALKLTFTCRHCGAAMIIVQTFARGQPIRAPPHQGCAL